jgi:capsular polysaccharide biosynthesis protein
VDLVSIASVLWKQKWLALPVVLLTALAAVYVVKIKPPVYDATSTVLLTNPPKATQSQIAADPSLKKANSDNIFADYGDLDIVANAVIDYVTSPASGAGLTKAGAGTGYQIALSTDSDNPPIIDITGVGSTARAAVTSARVVTAAVEQDLVTLQLDQGVDPFYLIGGDNVVKPTSAQRSSSAKLRSLVAVLGVGIVLLFIVVSSADAAARRRRNRRVGAPPQDDYQPTPRTAFEALR